MDNKSDMEIIEAIFKSPEQSNKLLDSFKPAIVGGLLCVVLGLPIVAKFIETAGLKGDIMLNLVKFVVFVIIFYLFSKSS